MSGSCDGSSPLIVAAFTSPLASIAISESEAARIVCKKVLSRREPTSIRPGVFVGSAALIGVIERIMRPFGSL